VTRRRSAPRCTSTWRQMAETELIRCARMGGHGGQHHNTAAQRQWSDDTENCPEYCGHPGRCADDRAAISAAERAAEARAERWYEEGF